MDVQLVNVCHARSGDKGQHCTIGLVPWEPELYAVLVEQVTPQAVRAHFGDWVRGPVERYELPRIPALSFVLNNALDGGGVRSLRIDAQGKAMCEAMLSMRVVLPDEFAALGVRLRPSLSTPRLGVRFAPVGKAATDGVAITVVG